MAKIPELHQQVLDKASSPALGKYVWENGVGTQLGYSFSVIHALAYSFIGVQTIYLATNWNPIYWNTACLIVNSASLENEEDDDDDVNKQIEEYISRFGDDLSQEDYEELIKIKDKNKKIEKTTDYARQDKSK